MASRLVPRSTDAEPVHSGGPDDDLHDLVGQLNELREQRISALEEVIAARWPRRWLLSLRLRRRLRQSTNAYRWAGRSWHNRRAAWMTDAWVVSRDSGPRAGA
jgi:hypothetical protein